MKVADFFCGGGGFSEGFRQAGYEIVFAVDKWGPAVTTYKGNKPGVNVIQDDVIRISKLPDDEFNKLVPDTEVIIGSPPCQAFSQSNKSGNGDKTLGIQLIEAYLRIIARKKHKENSILKYWVLENVPHSQKYIKEVYSASDLELDGKWVLETRGEGAGIYNAKYYGAPTNRRRFLCGDFPKLEPLKTEKEVITLGEVLKSLGDPLSDDPVIVRDINYPGLELPKTEITDYKYIHRLAKFEWETAKRLKQDKGYMGRMSFPENLQKPSRTVMATMSTCSREAMVLSYGNKQYRLPTVREAASMMSFPIDYWFYGNSIATKHTLVGNAVPPKLSFAIATAIAKDSKIDIPNAYIPIQHDLNINFINLNGVPEIINTEKPRRAGAKFKYHIPYFIYSSYRVELTNYHSNFKEEKYKWSAEIHYSQGKKRAAKYDFVPTESLVPEAYKQDVVDFIEDMKCVVNDPNEFQHVYCMTSYDRNRTRQIGPYELLEKVRSFLTNLIPDEELCRKTEVVSVPKGLPIGIAIGYYVLFHILNG